MYGASDRPTAEDLEALEQVLMLENISTWDASFLESINEYDEWTEKQAAKFDEILMRVGWL